MSKYEIEDGEYLIPAIVLVIKIAHLRRVKPDVKRIPAFNFMVNAVFD